MYLRKNSFLKYADSYLSAAPPHFISLESCRNCNTVKTVVNAVIVEFVFNTMPPPLELIFGLKKGEGVFKASDYLCSGLWDFEKLRKLRFEIGALDGGGGF